MSDNHTVPEQLRPFLGELIRGEDARSATRDRANEAFLNETGVLYHYTNAQGLQGILQGQKIWFTDYRHLNDPSELHFGIDTISQVLNELGNGSDDNHRYFVEAVASMLKKREKYTKQLEFFIASFSTDRDQLGQWRSYADDGRGFAIGFSPRHFRIGTSTRPQVFFSPISYGVDACSGKHNVSLEGALKVLSAAQEEYPDLLADQRTRENFIDEVGRSLLASSLIWNCLTSKHPAYKHEKEARLLILGARETLAKQIKTRIRRSEIVPYIPVSMVLTDPDAIAEIVAGPAAPTDSERLVRTMLREYGYPVDKIPVSASDIPYRSTR